MPRTEEQFEEMRRKSKKNIMEAAMRLFASDGYHRTATSKIAKEAGVSTGLLYNYFPGKEALLEEIIDNSLLRIAEDIHCSIEKLETREEFIIFFDIFFKLIQEQKNMWKLLVRILLEPELIQSGRKNIQRHFNHLEMLFTRYYKANNVENCEIKAKTLVAFVHGAVLNYIVSDGDQIIEIIRTGIVGTFI